MLIRVDFAIPLVRTLFGSIYDRIVKFAIEQGDTENDGALKVKALLNNTPLVQAFVNISERTGTIDAHVLISFRQLEDKYEAFVDQMLVDDNKNTEFAQQILEYIESLENVSSIYMLTSEIRARAYKKKYGFTTHKILMKREILRD